MLKYKLLISLIGVIFMTTSLFVNVSASTGMGGDPPGKGKDNPQPNRVGNEDEKDRDGPGGESAEGDDEGEANCWGKVTSDGTRTLEPGEFGQHAANPTGDDDNDTPREGVGNQDEDHPSDHADSVGGAFSDEECAED
jgi:hypothetical protein